MLNITSKSFELTTTIRDHIESSLDKINKYNISITENHFILDKDGHQFSCEVILHSNIGKLFAKCTDNDLYQAITKTKQKIIHQIQHKKIS